MALDQKTKFIGAIAVQLIAIFSIIFFKLIVLGSGTEILLHVAPVDPRDYLRGDYVAFQYDISSIRKYNFDYSPVNIGDVVYVPLVRSGQYWTNTGLLERATKTKPKNGRVYIRGTVISGGKVPGSNSWSVNDDLYVLEYGIEQKFIQVGTGTNFSFWDHDVSVTVRVSDSGEAVLEKIYVDGKEWPEKSE
jgi:uncharacterized membrane-anchored protein